MPHSIQAFTLLELIAVMALLSVVLAVAAPRLSGFMKGRDVDEECRRLLALTRYARSEAIGRGQRMELWIDSDAGEYGLRPESSAEAQTEELRFKLADKIALAVEETDSEALASDAVILFWPDGTIDEDAPEDLVLSENEQERYEIVLADNRLEYTAEAVGDE